MKKIFLYTLLALVFFNLQSCEKDTEDSFSAAAEPIFYVNALFGNSDILLEAGREDFYMFTDFEIDSLDVYTFTGRFAKLDACLSDCDEALSISIRDSRQHEEGAFAPANLDDLSNITYDFAGTSGGTDLTSYEITCTDQSVYSSANQLLFNWTYPGGFGNQYEAVFTETFSPDAFSNGLDISLTVQVEGQNACSDTYNKIIPFDYQADCFNAVNFEIIPITGTPNYQVIPYNSDSPDWVYTWVTSFLDTLTVKAPGTYCLTVTNNFGCTNDRCITISNLNQDVDSIEYCSAAFSYEVKPIEGPSIEDMFDFSNIVIAYTAKDGTEYRSDRLPQPGSSYFRILDESSYDKNEFLQPTIKLNTEFKCVLYNEAGDGVLLDRGVASVAVAIP